MFGKNRTRENAQRFSIKKYSIGVVSVLLGLAFLGGTIVQAEEPTNLGNQLIQPNANTSPQGLEETQPVSLTPEPNAVSDIVSPEVVSESLNTPAPVVASEVLQSSVVSVEDYQKMTADKKETTVEGYITGSLKSGNAYGNEYSNLALGATKDAEAKDTIPVQLVSKSEVRKNFNVKDNPSYIGKKVRVTGISETYFNKIGIKSTSKIELVEDGSVSVEDKPIEPPVPLEPVSSNLTPIAHLRTYEQGKEYSFLGKVISPVNAWGGQGFYVQDKSGAGIYVYPKQDLSFKQGDVVELTGTLSKYGSELQVVDITASKKIAGDINTTLTTLTIPTLSADKQSTLIKLENIKVGTISNDSFDNATFDVTDKDGKVVSVRLDSRSGFTATALREKINTNDEIHVTGILSSFKEANQVKPFSLDHFEIVKKAEQAPVLEVTVAQVQGEGHVSPLVGKQVTVKDVVVTYVEKDNKFYVQDLVPDGNAKTSDGIAVFLPKHKVKVGDKLEITGEVEEYLGDGYSDKAETDLTVTQIKANETRVVGTAEVPKAIVLGEDRVAPTKIIDDDAFKEFDPENDALDFWETLEGQLVTVKGARVLGPQRYGEIYVVPGNDTTKKNNSGGITLQSDSYNPQKIALLTTNRKFVAKAGDYFGKDITGPISYSYTNYKLLVDNKALESHQDGGLKPEVSRIVKDPAKLMIASYNIENFSANKKGTSDEKVARIAKSFVSDLHSPDIITLIEVQDNNGETNDGTTDATKSAQRLIDAIAALGGPAYKYIDFAPENNADGGAPGGNIRTGFLYNSERVKLSDKPAAQPNESATWENGELKYSVARLNPTSPVWEGTRKVPVAEFEFNGEKVVLLGLHLNSKRGDMGVFGKVQPPQFKSEARRHQMAEDIKVFVEDGFAQNERANIVILGDYNDYEFTKTLSIIESAGLRNLVKHHEESDRYSYFHQGNNQTLDQAMISGHLADNYEFDMVHVNAAFMEEHGRASDHDPLLLQIDIRKVNEVPKDFPIVDKKPELTLPLSLTSKNEKINAPHAQTEVKPSPVVKEGQQTAGGAKQDIFNVSKAESLPALSDSDEHVMLVVGASVLLSSLAIASHKSKEY
ncbi:DUF6359 domain-containing protein [Streptococcus sp. S784/96/1]|uniref:DUF6359 domain-containing protein n=1 Tax=Streptococcus sp. S784/96/1 TaxID=2653499 RepID=UPI0013895AA3|nr:DUF6359 domain-containing protein [Streptococcus sp. S784/96/1]